MDFFSAILDFFSIFLNRKENDFTSKQKNYANSFFIISFLLSVGLILLSLPIIKNPYLLKILIISLTSSLTISIIIIYTFIQLKFIEATTFNNFLFYLTGLILIIGSFELFIIHYFSIFN